MIIIKNKYIRETGFEIFENEWKSYCKDINVVFKQIISKPCLIIPLHYEEIEGKRLTNNYFQVFKNSIIKIKLQLK